jgi:phosphoserine phosphatase
MGGSVLFQDALKERLAIIQPSKGDVESYLDKHPFQLTEGIEELVNLLHSKGKMVYLVSGGFRQVLFLVSICLSLFLSPSLLALTFELQFR